MRSAAVIAGKGGPRPGRGIGLDAVKAAAFALLAAPGAALAWQLYAGLLGPRPLAAAIQSTGLWALRWLVLSLAITPLRRLLDPPGLSRLRRWTGVAAFAYAAAHLGLYLADQDLRLWAALGEILSRFYLTVGAAALLILAALAATSTDAAARRLGGRRWRVLHRAAYLAAPLALLHDLLQARLGSAEPLAMAGLVAWLLLFRALARRGHGRETGRALLLLAVLAPAVALAEALQLHWRTGAPLGRILAADASLAAGWRPGQILALALAALVAALAARRLGAVLQARGRRPPASAG
ncbi:MAG: ferric reductase-like transmembrane domain-containing protein [Dongiaceae bacterium]